MSSSRRRSRSRSREPIPVPSPSDSGAPSRASDGSGRLPYDVKFEIEITTDAAKIAVRKCVEEWPERFGKRALGALLRAVAEASAYQRLVSREKARSEARGDIWYEEEVKPLARDICCEAYGQCPDDIAKKRQIERQGRQQ